ncbi:MAG: hypothetical protein KDD64_10825 [Bdellovibrionales bacterium]|nr:hypothetical protein [Bdellovibrionales bacterium]
MRQTYPQSTQHAPLYETAIPLSSGPLIDRSLERIQRISRTFQGIADTTVSAEKQPLNFSGDELALQTGENFRAAVRALSHVLQRGFESPLDVQRIVEESAALVNRNLSAPGTPLHRTWEGHPGHPSPESIIEELGLFHQEYLEKHRLFLEAVFRGNEHDIREQAISFAAWVEKRFNHEIHPLYDGCGRTSKAHAVAVLTIAGLSYPAFPNRERYMEFRALPLEEWTEKFREHLLDSL